MQLQKIDKAIYRKHLNIVIVSSILVFAGLSLGLAQAAIFLFTDGQGSHFEINLAGVVLAMFIVGFGLNKVKSNGFMYEVYYVWQLKQQLNYITRKMKAINTATEKDDVIAIKIMFFYYRACRQLYELDDNTIVMDELILKSNALDVRIESLNLEVSDKDFEPDWLNRY